MPDLDLADQIWNGRGVAYFRRGQFTCHHLMLLIDHHVQLAPCAPGRNVVFLLVPFVFSFR